VSARQVRAEHLVGRIVLDAGGQRAGHVEEIVLAEEGEECVVLEYHLGRYALLERLGQGRLGAALLRLVGGGRVYQGYAVPWHQMDLRDPDHPRLTCRCADLHPLP
jgi:sporulation protein YlmC with PRC-barrel domain